MIETGVAEEHMKDSNGHCVVAGERYAKVVYLQKASQNKKSVRYERAVRENPILIHMLLLLLLLFGRTLP